MTSTLLYYITGHGFGHARRSAEVIRLLLGRVPGLTVHIRTTAASHIFADLPAGRVYLHEAGLDPGAVELNPLAVDVSETIERLRLSLKSRDDLVARELEFIRRFWVDHIVADIPFIAGDVAEAADVPCIAVSNFTWDWIYQAYPPIEAGQGGQPELIREVQSSYAKMQAILKLPFGGSVEMFREVINVPLIASRSRRTVDEILVALAIERSDARPRVLVGMRGGVSAEALATAARQSPGCLFMCPQDMAETLPANVLTVNLGSHLSFADLLSVSHVVVSKLGYGIISDCIAQQAALLWPARSGFREDDVVRQEVPRYLKMQEISHADFFAGRWERSLSSLLRMPKPLDTADTNGAAVCAGLLADRFYK
jgi:hypothetical protein